MYHRKRNMRWGMGGEVIADCTSGLRVKPRKGDAILFYNMPGRGHGPGPQGMGHVDAAAFHAGCDVRIPPSMEGANDHSSNAGGNGAKIAANLWFFNQIPSKFVEERKAMENWREIWAESKEEEERFAELAASNKGRRKGRRKGRKGGKKLRSSGAKEDL